MQTSQALTPAALGERRRGEKPFWRMFGPGALVAVGYVDPGNWATSLAAGSLYGYKLLGVLLLANLLSMLLQSAALRLGVAGHRDLAAACREYCPPGLAL